MRAGGLKYPIEIYKNEDVRDEFGSKKKIWVKHITTRADIYWEKGRRIRDIEEMISSYTVQFRIRDYHKVDESMRVKYQGFFYRIEAIIPSDEKMMLTLMTEKVNE
ncbi:MAG: phage head closure protein [Eubacteriales bacterium]|nr:phage head closure protein [Eubacteriales bacterium]